MAQLEGTIVLSGLPPHRGLVVSLCFFRVAGPDAPPPFDGEPPAEAVVDCLGVYDHTDLHSESQQSEYAVNFGTERPQGHYYVQVRATLFRMQAGKVFAQVEQFFFTRRPLPVPPPGPVSLPVQWPPESIEQLHHYETVHPSSKGVNSGIVAGGAGELFRSLETEIGARRRLVAESPDAPTRQRHEAELARLSAQLEKHRKKSPWYLF